MINRFRVKTVNVIRVMDVDPSVSCESSSPKHPPSPQFGAESAARRMRTDLQEDVNAMDPGTVAIFTRYNLRPPRKLDPRGFRPPCDFEAAMNNPMERWPAYQILFPVGEP